MTATQMRTAERRTFGRNVAVGLVNSIWSAAAAIVVTPVYLHVLGAENYGLITFFLTLQGLCLLLDLGFSTTLNREIAVSLATGDRHRARDLLATLAIVYTTVSIAIAVAIAIASGWISAHWIRAGASPDAVVRRAVELMALTLAFRLPVGIYLGALQGAQRSAEGALIGICATTFSTVGAVAVIVLLDRTVQAFFAWQALIAVVQLIATRAIAWRALSGGSGRFRPALLRSTFSFTAAVALATIAGTLVLQLDKLVVSASVSLVEVGRYGLATLIARPILLAVSPLFAALYPYITSLVRAGRESEIEQLYSFSTRAFVCASFPPVLFVGAFAPDLVTLWTGDAAAGAHLHWTVLALTLGYALNAAMFFPHALQLAYGEAQIPLAITVGMFAFLAPALLALVPSLGVLGAGLAWLGANVVNVAMSVALTHRRILPALAVRWLLLDLLLPLAAFSAILVGGASLLTSVGAVWRLVYGCSLVVACYLVVLAISADLREGIRAQLFGRGGRA